MLLFDLKILNMASLINFNMFNEEIIPILHKNSEKFPIYSIIQRVKTEKDATRKENTAIILHEHRSENP